MTTEHGPQAQNGTPEVTLLKCRLSHGPIAPPPPRTERKNKLADDWKEEKKHEQRGVGGGAEGRPQRQPTNILVSKTALQKAAHTQNHFGSGA